MHIKKAEKLYGLIGHPVAHSMSPLMHNDQFEQLELPYFYHAFDVEPKNLKEAVEGMKTLGVSGFNVTVPHKVNVMQYLDEIDHEARIIGAINTVVTENNKWVGYNTDGSGYVEALLKKTGEKLKDFKVLVIGAGGAARAVIAGLLSYGVKDITLTNRTRSKAEEIRDNIPYETSRLLVLDKSDAEEETPTFDLIINTTTVGMSPAEDQIPWKTNSLKQGCLCSDLIYNPLKTAWLREAERNGAEILNGVGMFVGQGAIAFRKWTGIEPNVERMTRVVLEQLGDD